jgi:Cu/Ag efflux protein CusF
MRGGARGRQPSGRIKALFLVSILVAHVSSNKAVEEEMRTWHWFSLAALVFSIALVGCGGGDATGKGPAGGNVYDIKGKVTAVSANKEKPTVKIDHEDIPGHMAAMEMEFPVADAKLVEGIQVGDKVQGKLEKRDTGDVIIKLEKR